MNLRTLNNGIKVSEYCLGTSNFSKLDTNECYQLIKTFINEGGNYFDCADVYESEKLLRPFLRKELVINSKYSCSLSKLKGNNKKCLIETLNQSLRNLQTDYIDIYWIHAWDYTMRPDNIMRQLNHAVQSGKVLHVGICNTPAWVIAQCNTIAQIKDWEPFTGIQIEYNLLERSAEHELIPMAKQLGIDVLGWSLLARGLLTGKHQESTQKIQKWYNEDNMKIADLITKHSINCLPSQLAINFAKHQGILPILGCSNCEQLLENIQPINVDYSEIEELTRPKPIYPQTVLKTGGWIDFRIK